MTHWPIQPETNQQQFMNHSIDIGTIEAGAQAVAAKATVLCVDDEQNILEALRRVFRRDGYHVLVADRGIEALATMERTKVDLVISDMRMPEMDGARFLSEVKRRWPDTVRLLLTGYADLESTVTAINEGGIYCYLAKPWEDNDLRMTVRRALDHKAAEEERRALLALTHRQNEELKALNASLEDKVRARTEEIRQTVSFLEMAYGQLKKSYQEAIPVFAQLIEMREGMAAGHGRRVADLAHAIGCELQFPEDELEQLYAAALLHDIGKIGLPDELVRTPHNGLTSAQQKEMKEHPIMGQAALMSLHSLDEAGRYIRSHHERYDGKGYPDGLALDQIPLGARILTVANEYDNLLSGTLLGEQLGRDDAQAFMVENHGKRYDPSVIDAFVRVLEREQGQGHYVSELKLTVADLRDGMVLTRDLFGRNDMLLLKRGQVLSHKFIVKLRQLQHDEGERFVVCVRVESGVGV
jgi:response regulator RpfG family c-di-GMP phosphodiesterase